ARVGDPLHARAPDACTTAAARRVVRTRGGPRAERARTGAFHSERTLRRIGTRRDRRQEIIGWAYGRRPVAHAGEIARGRGAAYVALHRGAAETVLGCSCAHRAGLAVTRRAAACVFAADAVLADTRRACIVRRARGAVRRVIE